MNDRDTDLREYRAKGADGQVHLTVAGPDALIDPSPYRTRCGQAVFEAYNAQVDLTCATCERLGPLHAGPAATGNPRSADIGTTIGPREPGRLVATVVAAVFLLVGVLGFVPGVTTGLDRLAFAGHHSGAMLLGIFAVSVLHNLVHMAFGVAGLVLATSARGARVFLVGGGVTYLLLWLYGTVVDSAGTANVLPVNTADNWLHLFLAFAMLGLAFLAGTPRRSTNTPMHTS